MMIHKGLRLLKAAIFHNQFELPHELSIVLHLASIPDTDILEVHLKSVKDLLTKAICELVTHLFEPESF